MFLLLSRCFNRKNGKNYTFSEATEMLDKKLENLGVQYQRQYDLLKGVIEAYDKEWALRDQEYRDEINKKFLRWEFF